MGACIRTRRCLLLGTGVLPCRTQFKLGVYLALILALAYVPGVALHESGHLAMDVVLGKTVYGFYVTALGGQVLAHPRKTMPWHGVQNLAGIIVTHMIGYSILPFLLRRKITSRLFVETFLMMFVTALLLDSVYLAGSGMLLFGDGYHAAKCFQVHSYWFGVVGLFLSAVNFWILLRLQRMWFVTFCPGGTFRDYRAIMWYSALALLVLAVPYYLVWCAHGTVDG